MNQKQYIAALNEAHRKENPEALIALCNSSRMKAIEQIRAILGKMNNPNVSYFSKKDKDNGHGISFLIF